MKDLGSEVSLKLHSVRQWPNQQKLRHLKEAPISSLAIRLGRWVTSVRNPHHGYLEPTTSELVLSVHTWLQQPFTHVICDVGRWKTILASMPGFSLDSASRKRHSATGQFSTIYQLDNPETFFAHAIRDGDNRQWVERALTKRGTVYMIIGYQTIHDPAFHGTIEPARGQSSAVSSSSGHASASALTTSSAGSFYTVSIVPVQYLTMTSD